MGGRCPPKRAAVSASANASVRRIRRGLVSWHWSVRANDRHLVLRRYNPWREDIAYEHRVLTHLAERDWPVAAPIPVADGNALIDIAGDKYALFPRPPGRPQPSNPNAAHTRRQLLAQPHAAPRA